ncbi:MAG: prepilin peptidase [Planctomycetes bacterium]|nr:prepilin peptidase [Planctomycetota bacterium]
MNFLLVEYAILLTGLFILGAVFGSMLNVGIYRLPREDNLWKALKFMFHPPSHCPRCLVPIRFYDNIPILGWLKLGGRCRNCRGKIAVRYPLIEALTGLLFVLLYVAEVPSQWGWKALQESSLWHLYGPADALSPLALANVRYACHLVLLIALIVATFIDFDLRVIPDSVTVPTMVIGALANTILGDVFIVPLWYQTPAMAGAAWGYFIPFRDVLSAPAWGWLNNWPHYLGVPQWMIAHPHWHGLCVSLAGIVVGGGSIWAVRLAGQWALQREAMGFGDVMLMAMIGSFIGWQGTLMVFALAIGLSVMVALPAALRRRDHELPYGPYLAGGTLILLLAGRWIWPWFDVHFLAMGPLLIPMALFLMGSLALMLLAWRTIQRRLGWGPPAEEWIEEARWDPGDQLAYLANQTSDDQHGRWRSDSWPGQSAARGQSQYRQWRYGG